MLSIEMLPAMEGDAIWVEYGDPNDGRRILVDCGYKSTYREVMKRLRPHPELRFELFVLTHIDRDHIAGAVPFIADGDVTPDRVGEVWFNGREQLDDRLGVREAEYFTRDLERRGFSWNTTFEGGPVVVPSTGVGDPISLPGGMRLTVLSPKREQLDTLLAEWEEALDEVLEGRTLDVLLEETPPALQPDVLGAPNVERLAAAAFEPDAEPPNGSSIAFLAEYTDIFDGEREKAVLFTGDCHAPVLQKSIEALLAARGANRLKLDAVKISHHGSKGNTSRELLDLIRSRHFLISTNGSRHKHPDRECIARIITSQHQPLDLHFNYMTEQNKMWRSPRLQREHRYSAHYPAEGKKGVTVTI